MRIFSILKSEKKNLPAPKPKESHKALIYQNEAKRIAQLTLQYPSIETGGSLFGYWTHSKSPIVSLASGPGRGSRHNHTSFYQNETYLHDMGTELYDQHGMQHIGEWHSHHRLGLNQPSEGDVNTIRFTINFNYIILDAICIYMTTVQTDFASGAKFFIANAIIF